MEEGNVEERDEERVCVCKRIRPPRSEKENGKKWSSNQIYPHSLLSVSPHSHWSLETSLDNIETFKNPPFFFDLQSFSRSHSLLYQWRTNVPSKAAALAVEIAILSAFLKIPPKYHKSFSITAGVIVCCLSITLRNNSHWFLINRPFASSTSIRMASSTPLLVPLNDICFHGGWTAVFDSPHLYLSPWTTFPAPLLRFLRYASYLLVRISTKRSRIHLFDIGIACWVWSAGPWGSGTIT